MLVEGGGSQSDKAKIDTASSPGSIGAAEARAIKAEIVCQTVKADYGKARLASATLTKHRYNDSHRCEDCAGPSSEIGRVFFACDV